MKRRNKTLALLLTAAMAASMMAGCGGSKESGSSAASTTETASSEAKPGNREGEVNQTANEAARDEATDRTMTFGIQEYSIGIDPAQEINTAWNCSRYGVGECLFKFDNAMNVENTLCDSYNVNDEHTVWEFHIRDGVTFSDGCACDAEAVKASFERLYEAGEDGSSVPDKYMSKDSEIVADNASNTVTITTPAPVVDLTKNLAYPVMIILDTQHTEDYATAAIGTGPYIMTNFREHVGATMVRNENYWNGTVPYASIELLYMGDASAKAMAMKSGQLDLTENITNIADLRELQQNPDYTVTIANGVRTGLGHMNVSEGKLLNNKTLRQALLMALDDETMCEVTVGGLYTSGCSVLPSNLDYGYDKLVDPAAYDPDGAVALLDENDIIDRDNDGIREMPDGTPVKLKYVTYPNRCLADFAEAIKQQLDAIGIFIDLEITDGAGQWDSYQSGDFDINASNWTTVGTGDPTEYLAAWCSTSGADYCGYKNEEYDKLFEELKTTFDDAARKEIIQKLQQILLDDCAVVVHGYYNSSMISKNETIGGAAIHTADYYWVTTEIYPASK